MSVSRPPTGAPVTRSKFYGNAMRRRAQEGQKATFPPFRSRWVLIFPHPPAMNLRRGLQGQVHRGDGTFVQVLRVQNQEIGSQGLVEMPGDTKQVALALA